MAALSSRYVLLCGRFQSFPLRKPLFLFQLLKLVIHDVSPQHFCLFKICTAKHIIWFGKSLMRTLCCFCLRSFMNVMDKVPSVASHSTSTLSVPCRPHTLLLLVGLLLIFQKGMQCRRRPRDYAFWPVMGVHGSAPFWDNTHIQLAASTNLFSEHLDDPWRQTWEGLCHPHLKISPSASDGRIEIL